jgi:uncharacterized protein YbbK (DUF523 family)
VTTATSRPRVGISRCLLGDEVRYDGTHKRDQAVIDALGPFVEWVPVCPEVEIGMGTPREPVHLVTNGVTNGVTDGMTNGAGAGAAGTAIRMLGVQSGVDWTGRMRAWAADRLATLTVLALSGYVFKARSPSCGIRAVPIHDGDETRPGQGLFAHALIDALPDLPVADEEMLADPRAREDFLERVRRKHATTRSSL